MMKNIKIMWVVIAAVLLLMDIPRAQVQTWNSWKNWQTEVSGLINTNGLVLFVDPGHQIIGGEQNDSYNTLTYGSELVSNPNFSDFTFPGRHSDNFTNNWSNNIDDDTTFSAEVNSSPTFASAGNWVIRGNWSVASDSLLHAAGATIDTAAHGHSISAGETAKIYAEIAVFADTLFMKLGNTVIDTFAVSDTVHKELTLTNTDSLYLIANAAFDGGVDTLSLVEKYEGIVADWKLIDQYQTDKSHYLVGNRYAAKFDGSSKLINSSSDFNMGTGNFTWVADVSVQEDMSINPIIFQKGAIAANEFTTYLSNANLRVYIATTASDFPLFYSPKESFQVAVVRDGNDLLVYKDGILFGTDNNAFTGFDMTNSDPFQIGLRDGTNYGKGFSKSVQVYEKALSTSEVSQLANGTIPTDSLVANWQFDNPDTWLLDQSGNGHDLTNSGVDLVHGNAGYIGQDWARGGALKDTSGNLLNGHHLTPNGGLLSNTYDEASPTYSGGYTQYFDGIDDYLSLPNGQDADLQPGVGDFSVSGWFRTSSNQTGFGYMVWTGAQGAPTPGYWIYHYENGSFNAKTGNGIDRTEVSAGIVSFDTWHHFTLTKDGTNTKLYVDGIEEDSDASQTGSHSHDSGFRVGGSAGYYNGHLSDITYHNRALSANEVKELYAEPPSWNWNEDSSIGKSGFAVTLGSTDTLSQTISTIDGYLYEADTNSVNYDYANEDDYNLQVQNGTFTSTSVKQVTNASWTDVTTVQNYAATSDSGSMKNSMETAQPLNPYGIETDGIDDYVDFGDNFDTGANDWCWQGWIFADDVSSIYIATKYEDANNYWYIGTEADDSLIVKAVDNTTTAYEYTGAPLTDGIWQFVTITKNSSTINIYINDGSNTSKAKTTVQAVTVENAGSFYLGRYNASYSAVILGMEPLYIFDGNNGRPTSLPSDIISAYKTYNYDNTMGYYQ